MTSVPRRRIGVIRRHRMQFWWTLSGADTKLCFLGWLQGLYPCSIRRTIAAVASLTLSSIVHALVSAMHVSACIESPHFARSFQTAAVPSHDHSSRISSHCVAADDVSALLFDHPLHSVPSYRRCVSDRRPCLPSAPLAAL
jgi:hypothetical protein